MEQKRKSLEGENIFSSTFHLIFLILQRWHSLLFSFVHVKLHNLKLMFILPHLGSEKQRALAGNAKNRVRLWKNSWKKFQFVFIFHRENLPPPVSYALVCKLRHGYALKIVNLMNASMQLNAISCWAAARKTTEKHDGNFSQFSFYFFIFFIHC